MAVTLHIELVSLMFSLRFLDVVIGTTTNDEVEVSIACPDCVTVQRHNKGTL